MSTVRQQYFFGPPLFYVILDLQSEQWVGSGGSMATWLKPLDVFSTEQLQSMSPRQWRNLNSKSSEAGDSPAPAMALDGPSSMRLLPIMAARTREPPLDCWRVHQWHETPRSFQPVKASAEQAQFTGFPLEWRGKNRLFGQHYSALTFGVRHFRRTSGSSTTFSKFFHCSDAEEARAASMSRRPPYLHPSESISDSQSSHTPRSPRCDASKE